MASVAQVDDHDYEDDVDMDEEDYDSCDEFDDDDDPQPRETEINEEIQRLSSSEMEDLLLKDLKTQIRGKSFKIEKTRIRDVLFYFQKEIKAAGSSVGLNIWMENLLEWGTHFDNMKLGLEGMRQYYGYIDSCIRFFLLMGYFETVLMLLPLAAENTPSCNVDHLIHFCIFKYKTLLAGKPGGHRTPSRN